MGKQAAPSGARGRQKAKALNPSGLCAWHGQHGSYVSALLIFIFPVLAVWWFVPLPTLMSWTREENQNLRPCYSLLKYPRMHSPKWNSTSKKVPRKNAEFEIMYCQPRSLPKWPFHQRWACCNGNGKISSSHGLNGYFDPGFIYLHSGVHFFPPSPPYN